MAWSSSSEHIVTGVLPSSSDGNADGEGLTGQQSSQPADHAGMVWRYERVDVRRRTDARVVAQEHAAVSKMG